MQSNKSAFAGLASLLNLPAVARVFWALYRDRRVSAWLKVCALAGVVYIFSPLDAIPDAITGIGMLDDILVSLLIMQTFIDLAPRDVMIEHCMRLNIDPARLNVDVAKALGQALNLAALLIENRRRMQAAEIPTDGKVQDPASEAGSVPGAEPRYKRYSAFQKEPDNS